MRSHKQLPCLLFIALLAAQPLAASPQAFREIPVRMNEFVTGHFAAGVVTLVATPDEILALDAVGYADIAAKIPMRTDHLFWIASMTKPMTAAAVLMLQDEGKLSVHDPVERFLPEFKDQWLVDTQTETTRTLKRPSRPITLRDLLTHSAGLGRMQISRIDASLAEIATGHSQVPLLSEPATKWAYGNHSFAVLGRVIEVASGLSYAEFMQQRILTPLEMHDTTFSPSPAQLPRLAKSYLPGESGQALRERKPEPHFSVPDPRRTPHPGAGLFSTAEDVVKFYQMMLNDGVHRGHRLLSEGAITELTTTQSGDLKTGFSEGMSWGLGFQVVKTPQGATAMLAPGTFGHGGAYGTQSWADPVTNTIYILMIQRAALGNGDITDLRRVFQETAAAAVNTSR